MQLPLLGLCPIPPLSGGESGVAEGIQRQVSSSLHAVWLGVPRSLKPENFLS